MFLWHRMVKRLRNTWFSRSCYPCATSVLLALDHVPQKHFSRKSFKTKKHQLVTSCSYLLLLLHLPWHLQLMQLSQSSLTRLSLVPSSAQQRANDYNNKLLLPDTKDISSCGQQAETPQPALPVRKKTNTSLSNRQLDCSLCIGRSDS